MTSRIGRLALGIVQPAGETDSCDYAAGASVCLPRNGPSLFGQLKLRFKSDEELMEELQSGEADALTILFHRHSALIFRIAHRVLRDAGEAEDAVQQVFLDLFRSNRRFDPKKGSFKTWLLMFAYHRTFNRHRHLSASRFYDSQTTPLQIVASPPLAIAPLPLFTRESRVEESWNHALPAKTRATATGRRRVVRSFQRSGLHDWRAAASPMFVDSGTRVYEFRRPAKLPVEKSSALSLVASIQDPGQTDLFLPTAFEAGLSKPVHHVFHYDPDADASLKQPVYSRQNFDWSQYWVQRDEQPVRTLRNSAQ